MRDALVGVSLSAAIVLLGWLALVHAATPASADESVRGLGTLLTLLAGIFSAIWWHQSADLSNRLALQERPDPATQIEANVLNGAAATATALAVIAGVFSGLPWPSLEAELAGGCFLALLAISGDDIRGAVVISSHQRFHARSILGVIILVIAAALFIRRHFVL